jgi:hypothetical protein
MLRPVLQRLPRIGLDRLGAHTRIAVEISGLPVSEGLRQTHGRGRRATGVVPCRAEDGSIQ